MISKLIYTGFLSLFVWCFATTTQLPRLLYQNFIAPAAQQPAPVEANQQQQKIKRADTTPASTAQKQVIMPPAPQAQIKPKPAASQTPAQLGFFSQLVC